MSSILITGGTGYFAQGLVRRLLALDMSERICIFSRDEYKQALMRQRFKDDARLRFFVGDVRDRDRLTRAMLGVDTVIHAAALKRIEVGKYNPCEMVKTNVFGTMNVIDAATDARVGRVVMLSTDKACAPVSAYGHSKAMAECLILAANNMHGEHGPKFACTRYGNVAGSTGSVIPTWRRLIEAGELTRVPVSDPGVTRFWMTEDQAVTMVLDTLDTMQGGELVIPALPAYRLGDLAAAMGVEYEIVGLPAWEKKHECMREGESSEHAPRMVISEIRTALESIR